MSNLVGLSQQAQDLFSIEYQHIFFLTKETRNPLALAGG